MNKHHSNKIDFNGAIRQYLLTEFCRRQDLIGICNIDVMFDAHFEKVRGAVYQGTCPWCRQQNCFTINSRIGACSCSNCHTTGDFLDMMCLFLDGDLTCAVNYVLECILDYDRKQREKRKESRARRRVCKQPERGVV